MITRPTVLVLGAGASIDYGFPSGWELVRIVCSQLKGGAAASMLDAWGFDHAQRQAFADALWHSGSMSVDAFLEHRQDLVRLGKLAIAAALIPHEEPSQLHAKRSQPPWLYWLSARMSASLGDWHANQLSIVTFNYDRVVEHYFSVTLAHYFGLDAERAGELFRRTVRVVHVHGMLGELSSTAGPRARPFSQQVDPSTLLVAANGIRIIHEGASNDPEFEAARELLFDAQEVVFMGFGYHPTNMSRLLTGVRLEGKTVIGSSIGMEERERDVVRARYPNVLGLDTASTSLTNFIRRNAIFGN